VVALAIAAGAVLAIAEATDADKVGRAFESFHPTWIALAGAGQLLSTAAYVIAYRSVARAGDARTPPMAYVARLVVAGFGPFLIGGGFDLDRRAARARRGDGDRNVLVVLAMALLEWVILAPLACGAAIALLVEGAHIEASLLWPWAVAVPVGFALALWASGPRGSWVSRRRIARTPWAHGLLEGLRLLRRLISRPLHHPGALVGTTGYWAADIAAFFGALRVFGLEPGLGSVIIAYATGYIGSRRSLPLGGAGVTEVLLAYSLYWVGQPLAPALAAVVVYRGLNFVLTLAPGLVAYRGLHRRVQGGT